VKYWIDEVEKQSKIFVANFPILQEDIYGFFTKKEVMKLFFLVQLFNILMDLFFIFSIWNLFFAIFRRYDSILDYIFPFSMIILVLIPCVIVILSCFIQNRINRAINIMEKINWEVLNDGELYQLRLILTFLWIEEALQSSSEVIRKLKIAIQKKYYFIDEEYDKSFCFSMEITKILHNIKHKMKEGSTVL
jgi:hypothetical protein